MLHLFLAFLFETFALASSYKPLEDQEWTNCNSSIINMDYKRGSFLVNYKICHKNEANVPTEQDIIQISKKVFEFAAAAGLPDKQCFFLEELEIYKISTKLLNDKSRFPKSTNGLGKEIWGLYDPRIDETGKASIMVTEHADWNEIILAHELSHYWYDRMCWKQTWSKSDEQFALDFEKFLSK